MNGVKSVASERGFALIPTLLILVVLTLVAVSGLRSSTIEEMVSGNQKLAASSLFGAEQGVSQALDDLFAGTISDSGSEDDVTWSQGGTVSGTGYSADYTVSHLVRNATQVEDDDGRRYFVINSVGTTTAGEARRTLEVAVALEWGANSNVAGLVGCQGVTGDGNIVTGSYSSSGQESDGDRGDIATTDPEALVYLDGSSDMDVVGEVRSAGAIYMKSDSMIRRDALANLQIKVEDGDILGSAYTNDQYYGSSSSVHGDIYQNYHVDPLVTGTCDPLDIDAIFNSVTGPIVLGNDNEELGVSAGASFNNSTSEIGVDGVSSDYWFNNFTLDSEAELTVHGNVRMYITGDFLMDSNPELILAPGASLEIYMESGRFEMNSNAIANNGGMPIDLQVYSKAENTVKDDKNWEDNEPDVWDPGDAKVYLSSNNIFYGVIYAPRAHCWLDSNAGLYGSVRCRFVTTLSNLGFTYDEDLDALYSGNPSDYKLVYWTERYPQ